MKIRITLEATKKDRRAIAFHEQKEGLADREDVIEMIETLWDAHLDSLHFDLERYEETTP